MIINPVVVDMDVGSNLAIEMEVNATFPISPIDLQEKSVTPDEDTIYVIPDEGYGGLSRVIVAPIPDNYGRIIRTGANIKVY